MEAANSRVGAPRPKAGYSSFWWKGGLVTLLSQKTQTSHQTRSSLGLGLGSLLAAAVHGAPTPLRPCAGIRGSSAWLPAGAALRSEFRSKRGRPSCSRSQPGLCSCIWKVLLPERWCGPGEGDRPRAPLVLVRGPEVRFWDSGGRVQCEKPGPSNEETGPRGPLCLPVPSGAACSLRSREVGACGGRAKGRGFLSLLQARGRTSVRPASEPSP